MRTNRGEFMGEETTVVLQYSKKVQYRQTAFKGALIETETGCDGLSLGEMNSKRNRRIPGVNGCARWASEAGRRHLLTARLWACAAIGRLFEMRFRLVHLIPYCRPLTPAAETVCPMVCSLQAYGSNDPVADPFRSCMSWLRRRLRAKLGQRDRV
jgi:hypothetical protein